MEPSLITFTGIPPCLTFFPLTSSLSSLPLMIWGRFCETKSSGKGQKMAFCEGLIMQKWSYSLLKTCWIKRVPVEFSFPVLSQMRMHMCGRSDADSCQVFHQTRQTSSGKNMQQWAQNKKKKRKRQLIWMYVGCSYVLRAQWFTHFVLVSERKCFVKEKYTQDSFIPLANTCWSNLLYLLMNTDLNRSRCTNTRFVFAFIYRITL